MRAPQRRAAQEERSECSLAGAVAPRRTGTAKERNGRGATRPPSLRASRRWTAPHQRLVSAAARVAAPPGRGPLCAEDPRRFGGDTRRYADVFRHAMAAEAFEIIDRSLGAGGEVADHEVLRARPTRALVVILHREHIYQDAFVRVLAARAVALLLDESKPGRAGASLPRGHGRRAFFEEMDGGGRSASSTWSPSSRSSAPTTRCGARSGASRRPSRWRYVGTGRAARRNTTTTIRGARPRTHLEGSTSTIRRRAKRGGRGPSRPQTGSPTRSCRPWPTPGRRRRAAAGAGHDDITHPRPSRHGQDEGAASLLLASKGRVLACAPSNRAVLELLDRFRAPAGGARCSWASGAVETHVAYEPCRSPGSPWDAARFSEILFCTPATAGRPDLRPIVGARERLVVDEAGQGIEPERAVRRRSGAGPALRALRRSDAAAADGPLGGRRRGRAWVVADGAASRSATPICAAPSTSSGGCTPPSAPFRTLLTTAGACATRRAVARTAPGLAALFHHENAAC